ncbi:DUF3159 domain-containing protein [Fusibacter sp. JL216-2]|uniref:DUF3159 domain-containing protein n=1 Tax=Fusibacter sp. JL216-2 TaxID=3071453 RepID=UPI003D34FC32
MIEKIKEIGDEFKTISMTGTGDAVVLPIAFLFINNRWGAQTAGPSTLVFSIFLILLRKKQGKPLKYIALGCLGSVTAAVFTLISQRSENYFLPDLMGNAFILCIALGSLMYKKPLAAWASHLTRGWDIEWYWRKDVLPAYYEVTIGWSVFFAVRALIQIWFFLYGSLQSLTIYSVLMGVPATVFVLTPTYIYGIWRLKELKGPSVDEYLEKASPPWVGQRKGF